MKPTKGAEKVMGVCRRSSVILERICSLALSEAKKKEEKKTYSGVVACKSNEVCNNDERGAGDESNRGLEIKSGTGRPGGKPRLDRRVGAVVDVDAVARDSEDDEAHEEGEGGGGSTSGIEETQRANL